MWGKRDWCEFPNRLNSLFRCGCLGIMPPRKIDERDLDELLKHLSDRQIADLYDMPIQEVQNLRFERVRQRKNPSRPDPDE